MSSVDNRIVEMQFNNKRFEQNAKETMSTLDKLKEKLNFRDSTKELQDFQNASDSFNLSHISNAVDEIGDRFTLMGQIGMQAMQRIASAALDLGTNLLKSISVDQISAGMAKYEEETNIIQTIYGALKPKGTKLEEIYDVMETLTAYSDETSYNYNQMADAISKFVNAGVDLNKAETVIEGISNAAAKAGIGIHDTAIIYRNFADAIGKGGFKLQDWNSIKTAHMDTEWLKEAFIEQAISMGVLDKSGRVKVKDAKYNKKGQMTQEAQYKNVRQDFEGTLSSGWLSTAVINATMLKYADRELEGFGKEAFAAAQNAKTFTDVLDAVKDAASTGWSRSFRLIFGNLEEAIELFTPMANAIIGVVNEIDEARNTVLEKWKDLGGRNILIQSLKNIWEGFTAIKDVVYDSLETVFNFNRGTTGTAADLLLLTARIKATTMSFTRWIKDTEHGGARLKKIQSIIESVMSVINIVKTIIGQAAWVVGTVFREQIVPIIDAAIDLFAEIGADLTGLNYDVNHSLGIVNFFMSIGEALKPITSRIPKLIKKIQELYKGFKNFWNTNKRFVAFRKSVEKAINAFVKFIPNAIESIINFGKSIVETVKNSDEWKTIQDNYNKYIKPWAERIERLAQKFNEALADFFDMGTSDESTMWGKIKKRFSAFEKLGPWLQLTWDKLKKDLPWLKDVEDWWNANPVINEIKDWVTEIGTAIDTFLSADTSGETSIVGKIKKRFEAMWDQLGPWLEGKWAEYKEKWPFLQTIEDVLSGLFGWGKEAEAEAGEADESTEKTVGFLENIWNKISEFVGKIDPGKLILFGLAVKGLIDVYKTIKTLGGWASIGENIADAVEEFGKTLKEVRKNMKANRIVQTTTAVLEVAASIWLLADALMKVATLDWHQVGVGLASLGGLFVEEGAFVVAMTKFNKGAGKTKMASLIGIGASMWLLADALLKVSELDWHQVGVGLATMGGLFVESGAFYILVNRLGNTSIFSKKAANTANMLALAESIDKLAGTLKKLAAMSWKKIGKGLAAMLGLFVEEGAFTILVNKFGSRGPFKGGGTSIGSMVGTTSSIMILADKLKSLSEMNGDEIKRGLGAMAGIFAEEGAFMAIIGFLSKKGINGANAVNATTGVLAYGIGAIGDSMAKLGQLSRKQIIKGALAIGAIELLLGAFTGVMDKFGTVSFGQSASMVVTAGAIWILVQTFMPLITINWSQFKQGIVVMGSVMLGLGVFCALMSKVQMGFKSALGVIVSAISLAALMVAFAFALTLIKDVDIGHILAFGAAMLLVAGAMDELSQALKVFSTMSVGAAAKGAVIMIIAAAALAAAVALILAIVGGAIEDFSNNIAVVGANLAQYSDMVSAIDMDAVNNSVTMIKDLSATFVEIGAKDYGNLETFKTNLTRMGASLKLFGLNTADLNTEQMKGITSALKDMATDLSGLSAVDDVSTTIGNIGGAIKLYSESLDGVSLDNAPDSTAIKQVFDTLKGAIPDDENLSEVAAYADEGKGDDMTNFAIGLTNIATAVGSFSESAKDLDFTHMEQAIGALDAIASLNNHFGTTTVEAIGGFGAFGNKVTEEKGNLSTFAEDIVTLGTSLEAFGDNISKVKIEDLTSGADVLEKIAGINGKLPKEGGISSWLTGSVSLTRFAAQLRLLGNGAKEFNDSIMGGEHPFEADKVAAAGEALIKIAEVNGKLPKTGGISSWFTGDESLSGFGSSLKQLGTGIVEFVDAIGDTKVTNDMLDAIGMISRIATIQIRLGNANAWYGIDTIGSELSNAATSLVALNNTITGVTWADTTAFEHLIDFAVDQQTKLGETRFNKSLKNIGQDIKDFFNEVWGFTKDWLGNDSGKLDKVTESVTSIFTVLNNSFTNLNSTGSFTATGESLLTMISDGFTDSNSVTKIENSVVTIVNKITAKMKSYTGKGQAFYNVGTWIPAGLADGILANQSAVVNAIIDVVNAGVQAGRDTAEINSPSRVFAEMGMYMDYGLAKGLRDNVTVVSEAGKTVSENALATVLEELKAITDLPLDQMEVNPTIRPVLDTSDISSRAGMIDNMLGGMRTIGFNTRQLEAQAQILGEAQGNDLMAITQQVTELRNTMTDMTEKMTHLQIVLNNGTLVGALESDIDRALGARARRGERGG